MRKLILILSTLMIVIALGGPVLTGHYAERIVREGQPLVVESLPDWLQLVESSYERGWFNATAHHRLLVTDPERAGMLRSWLTDGDFGDEPAIVVRSRIAHGPLVNIATLALADVRSRLSVDGGEADKELPALLNTRIGLNGRTDFRVLLADGAAKRAQGDINWSRVVLGYSPVTATGPIVVDITADALEYAAGERQTRLEEVDTTVTLTTNQPRASLAARYTAKIAGADNSSSEVEGEWSLNGLTIEALMAARDLVVAGQQSAGQDPATLLAENAATLRAAFATPLALSWQQNLQSAGGPLDLTLSVDTPAADIVPRAANVQSFLQTMLNESDLRLTTQTTKGYLESVATNDPAIAEQLTMLKGVGALQREDDSDRYTMTVIGKDGAVLVNDKVVFDSAQP